MRKSQKRYKDIKTAPELIVLKLFFVIYLIFLNLVQKQDNESKKEKIVSSLMRKSRDMFYKTARNDIYLLFQIPYHNYLFYYLLIPLQQFFYLKY
jgi:hypothetical protein